MSRDCSKAANIIKAAKTYGLADARAAHGPHLACSAAPNAVEFVGDRGDATVQVELGCRVTASYGAAKVC